MADFADFKDRIKRYFVFNSQELNGLVLTILIIGFIVSFRDWVVSPSGALESITTLKNIINGMIVAALIVVIHESVHRLSALYTGFTTYTRLWWPGLITGLVLAFATKGWAWFIVAPSIYVRHLPVHRLGKFRYGLNMFANGIICMSGIIAVMLFAILVKILLIYMPANFLLMKTLHVAIWFSIINILPIPPLNGSRILFMPGGPLIYIFTAFTVVGVALFLTIPVVQMWQILLLLAGGLIVGIIGWFYFLSTILK